MLSAEEASARLASLTDPDWLAKAQARADALPEELRPVAREFLVPAPSYFHGTESLDEFRQRQDTAAERLDEMSDDDRAAVMSALHPGLGPQLARWWVDEQARPYQRGRDRTGFRAPGLPGMSRYLRGTDLRALVTAAGPFEADPAWLAAWGGHLVSGTTTSWTSAPAALGGLLASAIDLGGTAGERTLSTLIDVGNGADPVGVMGQHVIVALLCSSRPEGWELMERLLLAAQVQEGLRQSILEAADMGHPGAFDRMLAIVLDRKLLRFASTVRAAGVWLGYGATVSEIPLAETRLRRLAAFRASEADRAAALASGDQWEVFLALCAGAMRDVAATIPELGALASSPSPALRAVMLFYMDATELWGGRLVTAGWLDDTDVRVAAIALSLLDDDALRGDGFFDAMGRLALRLPARERQEAGPGVEPASAPLSRAAVAGRMIHALGDRPATDLAPWLRHMNTEGRSAIVHAYLGVSWLFPRTQLPLTPQARQLLVGLLDDRSPRIRKAILRGLAEAGLEPPEVTVIEGLLTRTATDVRRGALEALAKLPPQAARESVARLAASGNQLQREAAAELARQVAPADDGVPADEAVPAADVGAPEDIPAAIAAGRSAPVIPRPQAARGRWDGELAWRIAEAIDALAEEHRNVPVILVNWQGSREVLFDNVGRPGFWFPSAGSPMLLGDVFMPWWRDRPAALRGHDEARDALTAYLQAHLPRSPHDGQVGWPNAPWLNASMRRFTQMKPGILRHVAAVEYVTAHLATELATPEIVDECLDAYEDALALASDSVLARTHLQGLEGTTYEPDWREGYGACPAARGLLSSLLAARPELFTAAQIGRWYGLERWLEAPVPDAVPHRSQTELLIAAHEAGVASDDDVAAAFLDISWSAGGRLFRQLTRRRAGDIGTRHPRVAAIAGRLRDRLVAVELRRGDLPAPTSHLVRSIGSVTGAGLAAELLAVLGDMPLARGRHSSYSSDRDATLSHLVRVSFPASGESGADLAAAAAAAGVRTARLTDLALYAPQWAVLAEEALAWPGLADGVLWLHAHTKDAQWSVDEEVRESWAAMTAERTPLSPADLLEGAVDVEWFQRAHATLGDSRWTVLSKAAKHASGGNGHRRAQVFAEAMLGQADEGTLLTRIRDKRDQDAVRALGLLQMPADPAARAEVTRRRYAALREFERGSRKFGAQRQASEKTAVRIGIENLARTAGYPDPQRFTWAVEALEAGDLADGPVSVTAGDVTLTLSVDAEGAPDLAVSRGGRSLKSVPAALRKDPGIAALAARKAALGKQATRVRQSLEAAMIAQDAFTAADFADLGRHPVVAPMLAQLVWVAEDGRARMLEAVPGQAAVPAPDGGLRIAHPGDLIADGSWVTWQERLFAAGRRQPFKQVFRELYALTGQERADGPVSRRYEGHQLQPRQAQALLITRGWLIDWESGEAARPFHRHGLTARVTFANRSLTLADVDLPAVDGVYFTRRGEYLAQPLDSVPGVVFSEAMRDLDLVVSVAHAGGVDPEATASTTQMRAGLIRETARLLKLANIEFAGGSHVIITGRLGEYSLHLGSGTVHRRPGGAVCIIPVGSQYRGRLFLPFADDDPKTAEIVSKALLLARDHEIKDPTILEQLRS